MPPKYQTIADDLQEKIRLGTFDSRRPLPTELDISQRYQVSRQTVRQALRVLVERGVIEKKQGSGSYIRGISEERVSVRQVAVVTTYISDYIFPGILRAVETVLSANHCTPSLFATQNQVSSEREVLGRLLAHHYDGILVEGTKTALPNPNLDLYQQLIDRDIPLVFMNGCYPQLGGTISVLDDNFGGGQQLADYLIGKGHTRIAGIFKSDDIQGHRRYAGYAAALSQAGLALDDGWTYWYSTQDKSRLLAKDAGATADLLAAVEPCTAVICYNDEIAGCLISLLAQQGVNVPQEIAVVSFDDSHISRMSQVPITSLSHGDRNVGKIAAGKLVQLMDGGVCDSELVPWKLMYRDSG